ncbi:MAG TPA: hypothetical protein VFY10_01675 [Dehalococcoidia bacterium]|nr:hypothetical protein [Dehalococcoidia bacterium]
MNLGRRPGAFVSFIDSYTDEVILKIEADPKGVSLVSYRLYDCNGSLVCDSDGPQTYPSGLDVLAPDGESLLHLPESAEETIAYRLYSPKGFLMTTSNGLRTQIYGSLRIEGSKHVTGRPAGAGNRQIASSSAAASTDSAS